ncbi:MAG: hypothetical protein ACFFF4_18995 [Candidatus Thorarchaeota archaeon]
MLEYTLATFLTGMAIICSSLFRGRKISRQKKLLDRLAILAEGHSIDYNGNIQYVGCYAHNWVVDNVTTETPGRIRVWIRKQVDSNPVFVISLFAFLAITSSLALVFIFFLSVISIGGEVGIFFVGLLIIVGTGAPRISEELLDALQKTDDDLLTWKDFAYALIARRTYIRSLITTCVLGLIFVVLSPWATVFVSLLAQGIVLFSDQVILLPAIAISELNMGLAFLYMVSVLPLLAYSTIKLIEILIQRYKNETGLLFSHKLN